MLCLDLLILHLVILGVSGKFAQATAGGIILGWVYLRYGIVVSLLIHWATNYFIFAYAHFISQINYVSLDIAFSNP